MLGLCVKCVVWGVALSGVWLAPVLGYELALCAGAGSRCVFVDPCTGQTRANAVVAVDTWHHMSYAALALPAQEPAPQHNTNLYSLESAGVPEGLVLETCQPDFSWFRRTKEWRCNVDPRTLVEITGTCTDTDPLNCLESAQFDAHSPAAVALGTTQLVRYSFAATWGCHQPNSLAPAERLSSEQTPNRVLPCEPVSGAVFQHSGGQCSFVCDGDHTLHGALCLGICGTMNAESCQTGTFASASCTDSTVRYTCEACDHEPSMQALAWDSARSTECVSQDCPPGSSGINGTCTPCAENTYAGAQSAACTVCGHGSYAGVGNAVCMPCFAEGSVAADTSTATPYCDTGQQLLKDVATIDAYFSLGVEYQLSKYDDMFLFCHQGFACLPCLPGYYEENGVCVECGYGYYQPNFQMSLCFACSQGQNTTHMASKDSSECVCQKGFDITRQ